MPPRAFGGVAFVALVVGAWLSRRRHRLSVPCSKCGRPAHGDATTPFCEQCVSVFVSGIAVEPRQRANKEVEVRKYQRRRRLVERLLSVTGLGLAVGDRPLEAIGLGFVVAASVGAIVSFPLLGVSSWAQPVGNEAHSVAVGVFVTAALVAAGVAVHRSWER